MASKVNGAFAAGADTLNAPIRNAPSAKGAAARRQKVNELASRLGGALDTATVLREFLNPAIRMHLF